MSQYKELDNPVLYSVRSAWIFGVEAYQNETHQ